MRVPLSWLGDYVPLGVSVEELADRLGTATAGVEAIQRRGVADVNGNLGLYRVGRDNDAHPTAFRFLGAFAQVPPYLEGLHLEGGVAHVMFESGSSVHRATAHPSIDRILPLDLGALTLSR